MIYVTGDIHGDISRLKSKAAKRIKKNDYLIICGDFGFIWDGSPKEKSLLKWLGKRPYNILFIEGTHDNLDLLGAYPTAEWNGGMVHEISGRLRHLVRGNVFTIDGKKIFVFGGGESGDMDSRLRDGMWWREELPTLEEITLARENLAKNNDEVDYIITHQSSRQIKRCFSTVDSDFNMLDVFFDKVRESCKYKRWFFGSYHINKIIPPSEMALFSSVVPVTMERP